MHRFWDCLSQVNLLAQLATIVQEFFVTNSILEPQTEERFQQFLSQKATRYQTCTSGLNTLAMHHSTCVKQSLRCRSYPKLEGLLDVLLLLYKIAWPFVVSLMSSLDHSCCTHLIKGYNQVSITHAHLLTQQRFAQYVLINQ